MTARLTSLGRTVGGLLLSTVLALARGLGVPVNLELVVGERPARRPPQTLHFGHFVTQLLLSAVIALLYASGLELLSQGSGWLAGTTRAVLHLAVGGVVLGLVPAFHPMLLQVLPAPGALLLGPGPEGLVVFLVLHLLYGIIVAELYVGMRARFAWQAAATPRRESIRVRLARATRNLAPERDTLRLPRESLPLT